jgi:tricarballylate dehydrogenase
VVLASGGFQANAAWRTRYLGPGWDLAKVRGTRFNTGDGIRMALDIGARSTGNWSGCHAVGWDRNAPEFGDRVVGDGFQKHSYPARSRRWAVDRSSAAGYSKVAPDVWPWPGPSGWSPCAGTLSSRTRPCSVQS